MRYLLLCSTLLATPAFASGTATPKPPAPPKVDLSGLPASASARPPAPAGHEHPVFAHLVADKASVAPGDSVRVGVLLEQQPGWHTYWKTPGDVGQPTDITWKLPDGATSDAYGYPVPQRFELDGIVSYGYEDGNFLFTTVHVPADAQPGKVDLGAHVHWLVCQTDCEPGDVDLSLPIDVGSAGGPTPYAPLFDHYAKRLPTPSSELSDVSVKVVSSQSAIRPNEPFQVAVRVVPKDGVTVAPPPADMTWPAFVPIATGDVMIDKVTAKPTDDHGLLVVIEAETLDVDAATEHTSMGGLLQLDLGGKTVATEASADVPWVAAGTAVAASTDPVWKETVALGIAAPPVPAAGTAVAAATPETDPVTTGPATGVGVGEGLAPGADAPADLFSMATLLMLGAAFVGGLLLNVMPCVLPVLTLKLYGLVGHGHHGAAERQKAGVFYTLGVLVSFWVLAGVVLALKATMGNVGWGFQFQSPHYVATLGAIVFAFGLSMFGVFEVPAIGADSASSASGKEGVAGHFFTGVFATLLGTPCSAPFLGPAMGFAFSQPGPVVVLFFSIVGLGLAFPFLLVAFVPALFRLMPKPGEWMETFKHVMGFTLIATTVWLVDVVGAQLGRDGQTGYLAFLAVVGFAAWLFGRYGGLAQTTGRQVAALAVALLVVALGGYRFLDFSARPEVAMAQGPVTASPSWIGGKIPWQPYSAASLDTLKGHPVFIDFTASWCLTCKVNEKAVLETDAIRDEMKKKCVVPLRGDWTNGDPDITAILQKYGRGGVPFYLVIPADGSAPIPLPEVITPDIVKDALDKSTSEICSL